MKIYFGIGSPRLGTSNTINISDLRDSSQIAKMEAIFASSELKTETHTHGSEDFLITAYFQETYANYLAIFEKMSYLKLKETLIDEFSELNDHFPNAEELAKTEEELNFLLESLDDYQHFGYFSSQKHIEMLQSKISELSIDVKRMQCRK